ncbi:MAG: NlpC/P60 family protein [Coriobacteriia bacterium]|nr:NlpC/P60 family protein [Coriobacteriia bacterium]
MSILSHKHSVVLRLLAFSLIAALMFPSILMATPAEEDDSSAEQTEYVQEQSNEASGNQDDEGSSDVEALRAQATQARIQLDQLALETAVASENYFEAQDLLETTLSEIEITEEQLNLNQEQLDHVGEMLADRAVGSYQNGELSFIAFLFGSSDITDFIARINMLVTIMDNDAEMIREARQLRSEIETNRAQLEEKRETERAAAETAQAEFETVQDSLGRQERLLASLDSEVHRLIEEERAAIEAEQLRIAQLQQAEEDSERLAAEEAGQSQVAQDAIDEEGNAGTAGAANNSSATNTGGAANSGAGGTGAGAGSNSNANSGNNTASNNNNTGSNNAGSGSSNAGGSGSTASRPPTSPPTNQTPSLGRERPGVVPAARRHIGVPYLWGGTTPAGFDCSGLVMFAYREAYGINLPRTSRQQFHAGVHIPPNRMDLMRPGDLVFFSSTGRPQNVHHVGIFIGNNRMIHAPQPGTSVREQVIWRHDFIGAVRP